MLSMLNQFSQREEIGFIAERDLSQLNAIHLFWLMNYFGEFQEHLIVYEAK
jgi:hypothetical protein